MNVASKIRSVIESKGPDSIWTAENFPGMPPQAILKSLSRLALSGLLHRVRKGVYYYPAQTILGASVPSTNSLIEKILTRGNRGPVYSGGTASFQYLGISTQVPATYTVLADSPSRKMRIGKFMVKIEHRPLGRWANASAREIAILDCLRNIKRPPGSTPETVILKILAIMRESPEVSRHLMKFAECEPPRVRALVGAMADYLGAGNTARLRKSVNPITKFELGIGKALPTAQKWGVA